MGIAYKRLVLGTFLVLLAVTTSFALVPGGASVSGSGFQDLEDLPNIQWDQATDVCPFGDAGCLFSDDCFDAPEFTGIVADDFSVPAPGWLLDGIFIAGARSSGVHGLMTSANYFIYADGGGIPGDVVCALTAVPTDTSDQTHLFDTSACPLLTPGGYWIGFNMTVPCDAGFWCWQGSATTNGFGAQVLDVNYCGPDWVPQGPGCDEDLVGGFIQDLCFAISAQDAPTIPTPATGKVGVAILLLLMMAATFYFLRRRQTA